MIVRTGKGFQIWDKKRAKPLSRDGLTRKEADKRLAQIEHYRRQAKTAKQQ